MVDKIKVWVSKDTQQKNIKGDWVENRREEKRITALLDRRNKKKKENEMDETIPSNQRWRWRWKMEKETYYRDGADIYPQQRLPIHDSED